MAATYQCPACTAPGLIRLPNGALSCSYCGSIYQGKPFVCPNCGTANIEARENCSQCGEPLSLIAQVMERGEKGSTPPWLQRTRTRAAGIKAREEQASEDRMRSFQEIDRIRIDQERKASQAQAKRDRTLYIMTFFFALVAIFAVILLALLLGS